MGDLIYVLFGLFVLFCYSITIEYYARKPEYRLEFVNDGKAQWYFGAFIATVLWPLSFPFYLAWLLFVLMQKAAKKIAAKLDSTKEG